MKQKLKTISFGSLDINSGEFKSGFVDKSGKMGFKNPLPWYKRIFGKKLFHKIWSDPKFICTFIRTQKWIDSPIFFGESKIFKNSIDLPLYFEQNIFTSKNRYYYIFDNQKYYINAEAFEKEYKIITL